MLVGGEGTRLRPLTETIPKPLVPLVDRPSLDHVLDHLARHGVREVVLSSSYLESTFHAFIQARRGDPRITWITEAEPLGTGGAIVNALDHLGDEPFVALNGDILTDLDLGAMLAFHRERGAVATIALTHVEDARPYGLVPTEPDGRVLEFREKPAEPVPGDINAGTYILEPAVLDRIPADRFTMFERDLFPTLVAERAPVYGYPSAGYWIDIGTPTKYLQVNRDLLTGRAPRHLAGCAPGEGVTAGAGCRIDPSARLVGPVVLGEGVQIGPEATVVGPAVIGAGCLIGPGAHVEDSVIWRQTRIGPRAVVQSAIVAEGCALDDEVRVTDGAVIADRCTIGRGNHLSRGLRLWPDRVLAPESITF